MLVKNGVVEKMFIEEDVPGDPFKVSDADTMLNFVAPEYKSQESITVFTKPGCPNPAGGWPAPWKLSI
jgi:peroxiredoxin